MLKEMKQQLVKKAIIDETKKQLLKNGIYKTSLRGIAKELGIAFGNIYYYFKSKADIADMVWAEYTHDFLDKFSNEISKAKWRSKTGKEKLQFYYEYLFEYFSNNRLYAELIAFLMGEKPRSERAPEEIINIADKAREAIKNSLVILYEQAQKDGSIKVNITDVIQEAWSFNIAYTFMVINIIRYDEIENETFNYFVKTYFDRLMNN